MVSVVVVVVNVATVMVMNIGGGGGCSGGEGVSSGVDYRVLQIRHDCWY